MDRLVFQNEMQAIQLLRDEVSKGPRKPRDELLFAIILLMRSTDAKVPLEDSKTQGAFRPPLADLQNLRTGSSLSYRTTHKEMLRSLVVQKGGLAEIAIPGLAEFFNM